MPTDAALAERPTLAVPDFNADEIALFLDLDGVLAAIEKEPLAVGPRPDRTAMLLRLQDRLDGRLAVVSGRTLDDIDRILDASVAVAAGIHGLERRHAGGRVERLEPAPGIAASIAALEAFAADWPGVIVEDKGLAAGLHFRAAPDAGEGAGRVIRDLAARHGLTLQPGDMIWEMKTPGADKGVALSAFMCEPPFAGFRPVMLGDDLTDEYAFRAARDLDGAGVLIGPMRATDALHRLPDQAAAFAWLDALSKSPKEAVR